MIFIHDNAYPCIAQLIQTLLKDLHWEQFEHRPYSPYLVSSDYHLFPQFKKELEGNVFKHEMCGLTLADCNKAKTKGIQSTE